MAHKEPEYIICCIFRRNRKNKNIVTMRRTKLYHQTIGICDKTRGCCIPHGLKFVSANREGENNLWLNVLFFTHTLTMTAKFLLCMANMLVAVGHSGGPRGIAGVSFEMPHSWDRQPVHILIRDSSYSFDYNFTYLLTPLKLPASIFYQIIMNFVLFACPVL